MPDSTQNSFVLKLVFSGLVVILAFIPSQWLLSLVGEREDIRQNAIVEVSGKWGDLQVVNGPLLSIPYSYEQKDADGNVKVTTNYAYFLPDELNTEGSVTTENRSRGIYDISVYETELVITGKFENLDFEELGIAEKDMLWEDASLLLGLTDMQGIEQEVTLTWNGTSGIFNPGVPDKDVIDNGMSISTPIQSGTAYSFQINLDLKGSTGLYFSPVGRTTTVEITSDWRNPSFDGAFLPESHEIGESGFTANWNILYLNRNYPQQWVGNAYNLANSEFGVELFVPADSYQKISRSAKYMVLFVFLTFFVFFFIEVLGKKRIHPIQYMLVAMALILFYLLLLSLSEHLGFDAAYLIATIGIAGMLGAYSKSILQSKKMAGMITLFFTALYLLLYVILQLADYSLLIGSILLFMVLAIVMYITRKVDWYNSLA
ncbi:MAG: Inner membrane CreD family protein, inner membrane protein [Candidatus Peregrinibacteria bacterium GW2011_GWF2_43_17]|nr:MAG: Inner membrane CreD family protein, inner membrane protein [Candidatus Peregrinibacteria bacterium GW2011_GWF2_43_17]KKT18201.1 MAG: hypothetical protein UW03_C0044G0005 [Candidatus Peregrinibacteria bacterium GW2011_GWA2_43_8]